MWRKAQVLFHLMSFCFLGEMTWEMDLKMDPRMPTAGKSRNIAPGPKCYSEYFHPEYFKALGHS